jgi:acyl carrier protein
MTREAGLAEITVEGDLRNAGNILEEIGYYTASTVKDAVVIDKEDENGNKSLWAYIIPETEISLSESELREYLSRELPDYMIPSYFVQVDEIPLSASGKVDKNALLKSEGTRLQMSATYVEPRDEKEKIIANFCKEVFKVDKIGVNDNFFNLGATSFTIIRLNSKLQEVFKKDIPVLVLFEYPTITSFLEYMDLEMPVPVDSLEEKDWVASKKEGQDKFKKLRNKRIRFEEMENG